MPDEIGNIYIRLKALLIAVAVGRFGVDEMTAEDVLHDVFMTFISRYSDIHDPRAYLVAAMSQACRRVRSRAGKWEGIGQEPLLDTQGSLDAKITATSVLGKVKSSHRTALELRYLEGHSVQSVAGRMGISEKYASNLIARAKREAAEICA